MVPHTKKRRTKRRDDDDGDYPRAHRFSSELAAANRSRSARGATTAGGSCVCLLVPA